MRYISTRGRAPARDFADVLLAGLAEDGGLYVPEAWPRFSPRRLRALRGLPYRRARRPRHAPFVGDAIAARDAASASAATPMPASATRRWRR